MYILSLFIVYLHSFTQKPAAKPVPSKNQTAKNGTASAPANKGKPAASSSESSDDDDSDEDEVSDAHL